MKEDAKLDKNLLKKMYTTMITIRTFEKEVLRMNAKNLLPGFIHSYIGEEASATGACATLTPEDYIVSTHRGHGHVIAKGCELKYMMAELFGKADGYCNGKGGSMHIADFSKGIIGANGIVGAGIPIATGAGLAAKLEKKGRVVLCFFGDGASNQGTFHESINMASIWDLPVIYLCENNQYAVSTSQNYHQRVKEVSERAAAYRIYGKSIDGNDVIAVYREIYKGSRPSCYIQDAGGSGRVEKEMPNKEIRVLPVAGSCYG
jgi:pyruvate dehydrogenase E1 component alpha subunit